MGAVVNWEPKPSPGILAEVPFVDVRQYDISTTALPLTPPEWREWGNPIKDRDGLPHDVVLFALRQRARVRTVRRC